MVDKKLFNYLFDSIIGDKVQFIITYNKDDVSEYVRDYFREEVYNWVSHENRIGKYNPEKGILDNYLTTLIRNYMGYQKNRMMHDDDYKKLVLKKYYREKQLNKIIKDD